MAEVEQWFYSGDEGIYNKATIDTKSKDLNDLGSRVYKRFYDWNKINEAIIRYEGIINSSVKTFNERYALLSQGTGSLNQQECEDVQKLIALHNNQLNDLRGQVNGYLKHLDPPVTHDSINKHCDDLTKVKFFYLEN
jgi:hypothetical protein